MSKKLCVIIIYFGLSFGINAQALKYETISNSGGNFTYDNYRGGFTVGEVGVKNYIGTEKCLEGFQYIEKENPYPGCLNVTSSLPDGDGSFRAAIDCALDNDEIIFDPSMADQFLFFDVPAISIDKPLKIKNINGVVKFRNLNVNNTIPLLLIGNNVTVEQGIELHGVNDGMIIHILAPYILTWK